MGRRVQRLWESFKCDRPVRSVMCSENPAAKGCPRRDKNVARRVEGVKANQQRKVAEQRREAEQRELDFTNSGRRVVVQWGEQAGSHTVPRSVPSPNAACLLAVMRPAEGAHDHLGGQRAHAGLMRAYHRTLM